MNYAKRDYPYFVVSYSYLKLFTPAEAIYATMLYHQKKIKPAGLERLKAKLDLTVVADIYPDPDSKSYCEIRQEDWLALGPQKATFKAVRERSPRWSKDSIAGLLRMNVPALDKMAQRMRQKNQISGRWKKMVFHPESQWKDDLEVKNATGVTALLANLKDTEIAQLKEELANLDTEVANKDTEVAQLKKELKKALRSIEEKSQVIQALIEANKERRTIGWL